jgi:XTP/dITP diphosphohydrolase
MVLYVATSNPGKLRDFATASNGRAAIEPLPNLANIPAPAEDEPTFEGNARVKAIAYSLHAPNQIVIADDSGLEVDALNGAPGVRSARYADDMNCPAPPATSLDERNNLCLLRELDCLPDNLRAARYRCVLAAARNGEILSIANGTVEGTILTAPRGTSGFGYDPLFYLPDQNKTMAELGPITRLSLSHRGRALRALLDDLLPQLQPH